MDSNVMHGWMPRKQVQIVQSQAQCVAFENRFPWDITTQILDHAVRVIHEGTSPRFIVSPYVLSQVCRDWQAYVDDTPSFWSSIVISLRQAKRWHKNYLLGLRNWVNHARGLPLSIYLDTVEVDQLEPGVQNIICQFLVESCSQWQSLDTPSVTVSFAQTYRRFFKLACLARIEAGLHLPNYLLLRSYVVRGPRGYNHVALLDDLESLKTLQVAHYDEYSFSYNPHTITNVNLTTYRQISLQVFLHAYPAATTIDIHYISRASPSLYRIDGETPPVKANLIRSLKIAVESSTDLMYYLHNLHTPNMEVLHLRSGDAIYDKEAFDLATCVQDLVKRSGCHLVHLSLTIAIFYESRFIDVLCSIPSLEELSVQHVEPESRRPSQPNFRGLSHLFFNRLHPDLDVSCLPNLRILTYEGPLAMDSLHSLESLVLRMLPRQAASMPPDFHSSDTGTSPRRRHSVVQLNFAKIVADQRSLLPEDPDASKRWKWRKQWKWRRQFVRVPDELQPQVRSLVDGNALWLLNADGSRWKLY